MTEFSLSTVGVLRQPGKRKPRRAISVKDSPAAILIIAKIIDPDAWSDQPRPSVDELQRQVTALSEDIEWLSTVPSSPEGEYQRIRAEQRQQDILAPRKMQADAAMTKERQNIALERARKALDAFQSFAQGRRPALVKVIRAGRKPRWFTRKGWR